MITEQCKDKVYFTKLLCTDCPNIYKDICEIFDANNVAHETLSLTKDYWCRDYMPVQYASERFSQFVEEFYKLKYCSTVVYMVPRA